MGGGGSIYNRDTADGYKTTSAGVSKQAEEKLSRSYVDDALLPKNRWIFSRAKSPVIYGFDVTGSMGTLPMVIYDKMPLIAGQIVENRYLVDPEVSLAAIGDIQGDKAPIQIGDFSPVKSLDDWLQRMWLEGNGGGNGGESYEYTAYFYARCCDMPNAETPFLLLTGDEHFRESLTKSELQKRFGGTHEAVDAQTIFDELKKKFKGNVFLIFASHGQDVTDNPILKQWQDALGKEYVVVLGTDKAVADVTLGIFALMTGSRTLDEYCEDLRTKRDKAQSKDRIAEVRKSLQQLEAIAPRKKSGDKGKSASSPTTTTPVPTPQGKKADAVANDDGMVGAPARRKKNKPGRI